MNSRKNNFFMVAPLPLWGCVSIWLSNLARLAPESVTPYAWASLVFSYGIVALHYIQIVVSSKDCNNASKARTAWIQLGIATVFLIVSVILALK